MKTTIVKAILFVAVLSLATGCAEVSKRGRVFNGIDGSGKIVTETRNIQSFSEIELNGQGLLLLEQGATESLTINTDDNLLEYITTEVRGDTLVIETKKKLDPTIDVRYTLSFAALDKIETNGSADVRCDALAAYTLDVVSNGSGDLNLGVDVKKLIVRAGGSGDLYLSGAAETQDVSINGSGNYRAEELSGSSAKVSITGSGDAVLYAADSLDVSITGSGNVSYSGSPEITRTVSGSGKISQLPQ